MAQRLLFALMVGVAAMSLAGCGTDKSTGDATVTACNADPGGGQPIAQGTVANTSSETSTFVLRIGFYDGSNNRVSEALVNIGDVEPGTTGSWETIGMARANGPLTCKVMSLNRTSVVNS